MTNFYKRIDCSNVVNTETSYVQDFISTVTDSIKVTCYPPWGVGNFVVDSWTGCTPNITGTQPAGTEITLSSLSGTYSFVIKGTTNNSYSFMKAVLTGKAGNILQTSGAISLGDLQTHFGTDASGVVSLLHYYRQYQSYIKGTIGTDLGSDIVPSFKAGTEFTNWTFLSQGISNAPASNTPDGGDIYIDGATLTDNFDGQYNASNDYAEFIHPSNGRIYHVYSNDTTGTYISAGNYVYDCYYRKTDDNAVAINTSVPPYLGPPITVSDSISLSDFYGTDNEGLDD